MGYVFPDASGGGGGGGGGGIMGFGAVGGSLEASLQRWGNGAVLPVPVDSILARIQATQPGTLSGLYVRILTAFGVGKGVTYTVRVNGADTAITCTISGAVATSASDAVNSVVVIAGDVVEIHITVASGVPANVQTIADVGIS